MQILNNVFPIFGVFFLGWNPFDLIFAYWLENLAVGIYTVLRLLQRGAWPMAAFFALHFGIFTIVHGIFILALFARQISLLSLSWPLLGLIISLFGAYFYKWLTVSERQRDGQITTQPAKANMSTLARNMLSNSELFMSPYRRIVPIHIVLIIGGMLSLTLDMPSVLPVLLVVVKVVIDVVAQRSEELDSE